MASKGQQTGMKGVYLVAAELVSRGFIVSPTSRNAQGADLLVTDSKCKRAFSIQVKTNASTFNFWLCGQKALETSSDSHIYVFVNLRKNSTEYFVVPSKVVKKHTYISNSKTKRSTWYSFSLEKAIPYKDEWSLLGKAS